MLQAQQNQKGAFIANCNGKKSANLQTLEFDLLENQLKSGLRTVRVLVEYLVLYSGDFFLNA